MYTITMTYCTNIKITKPATIIILFKKYYDKVGNIIIFLIRSAILIHISHCGCCLSVRNWRYTQLIRN